MLCDITVLHRQLNPGTLCADKSSGVHMNLLLMQGFPYLLQWKRCRSRQEKILYQLVLQMHMGELMSFRFVKAFLSHKKALGQGCQTPCGHQHWMGRQGCQIQLGKLWAYGERGWNLGRSGTSVENAMETTLQSIQFFPGIPISVVWR